MTYTLIVPPESPCGCENGKAFGDCHLGTDGNIQMIWQDFNPPLPGTGERIPKCHFAYTNNCGGGITKEHIISRAVLKEIDEKKIVFTTSAFTKELPINSDALKTKRLCRRHNTAFGRVDTQVGRFARTIQKLDQILQLRPERPIRAYLFAGFDLERWMLKTLLNVYYARLSVNPQAFSLPTNIQAAFNAPLRRPFGLYVPFKKGDGDILSYSIGKKAAFNLLTEGPQVTGISATLSGLELVFLMSGTMPYSPEFATKHTYRPKTLVYFQGQETVSVFMGWQEGDKMDIWMSRGDPAAITPEGIFSDYD